MYHPHMRRAKTEDDTKCMRFVKKGVVNLVPDEIPESKALLAVDSLSMEN